MQASRAIVRLVVALVVLGAVYLGVAAFLSSHVPSNTTVDRIAIGGMTPNAATVTLKRVLAARASQPIHLETPSRTVDIEPGTAGIDVDLDATLSDLTAFTVNPVEMWGRLTGGEDQPLRVRVDRAELTAAVTEAAKAVDAPVVEGSITFTGGKAIVVVSVAGQALNVPETTDAVASAWPGQQVVPAVMTITQPEVPAAEINRAAKEFATPAMSGPVRLVAGRTSVALQPTQYAPVLSLVADVNRTLQPKVDAAKLLALVRAAIPGAEGDPVDATVILVAGSPQVVPARAGSKLDVLTIPKSFLAALTSQTRTAPISMVSTPAKVTTEMARGWGIKEKVSTFTTQFPDNPPRTNNMRIAAAALNGTIVEPGAKFSLNSVLGERTPAKGYQRAPVIYADRLEQAYGGGVSQVSTTLFNAVFFSGARIEKYTPHSFYIARYPEGREATVSWPDVDQKWTNDSGFRILISSYLQGNDLTVTFYGTKTWDIEAVKGPRRNVVQPKTIVDDRQGCVPQSPNPGFDVTVTRIFKKNGAQVRTSTFNTHYRPEDGVTCTSAATG
ncbi:MAG TPA: VanW family protein [Dermatophilaceae bacterium]|nr:VanW family protein [Dermatophilaceae bacterium]